MAFSRCAAARASSSSSSARPRHACAAPLRPGRAPQRDTRRWFKVRGTPDAPVKPGVGDAPRAASWAWSSRFDALATFALAGVGGGGFAGGGAGGGVVVADVCCGHALLALGMCAREEVEKVIAIDRSELELVVARQNVRRGGEVIGEDAVSARVALREGDGLAAIEPNERVDIVVIAGVGGNTMTRILTDGGLALDGARQGVMRLVLNPPAKDAAQMRRWCAANGWEITNESLVVENGTMHVILCVDRNSSGACELTLSMRDEIIGPLLSKQSSDLVKLYIKKRLEWVREVRRQASQNLQRLKRQATPDAMAIAEGEIVVKSYDDMEEVLLDAMGISIEDQKRRVEEQFQESMKRGFQGFVEGDRELRDGELVYKTIDPAESDGRLGYCRGFLSGEEADSLLRSLLESPPVEWAQRSIVVWQPEENVTKEVIQPRLVSWAGDIPYKYSGQTLDPVQVSPVLATLMARVEEKCGASFNHILLNRYRDGMDSMALHADDEPELGRNATIAAISLGHTRRFDVQIKNKTKSKTSIFLENGSLMVMDGALQHTHYHGVPKNHVPVEGERINITFRLLKGPPGWREGDDDDDE